MNSEWAQVFAEHVQKIASESRSSASFPIAIGEALVVGTEAVFLGSTPRGTRAAVVVQTDVYARLFAGSIDGAASAFLVELMEPGWAKGDVPSQELIDLVERVAPGIWWLADGRPPSAPSPTP